MLSARCTSLLALVVASGCLKAGPLPEGSKLFPGRDIGGIGFVSIDGATWVSFSQRKAPATASKGAVSALRIASWDGTQHRLVIDDWSYRWFSGPISAGGSSFIMVDEQQVKSGDAGAGQVETVGTLVRIDPHYQPNVSFENVSNFALSGYDNRLLYRQVPTNGDTPGLFLWDGQDSLRLGDVATVSMLDAQVGGSGMAYFVLGTARILSRLGALTDPVQNLYANVSRFTLRPDEKYAALTLLKAGSSATVVVLDLQSGKDIPLARPNPPFLLGFTQPPDKPNLYTYSQSASGSAPAEYHTLDLVSGIDTTLVLPAPLVDLTTIMHRPPEPYDEDLYVDSQWHGVFFGHNDQQVRRIIPAKQLLLSPQFSPDGQYLIYIDPQPITVAEPYQHGLLMVQDSDLVNPPRQLSPPGMTLEAGRFFFINGPSTDAGASVILVFWAHIVRDADDLYFANYQTGELQVVASSIGSVTVLDYNHIFGTVNVSAQDNVGDLVVQDLHDSGGRILAHAVFEATQSPPWIGSGGLVAYTVRGRVASDHDGLWGTTLAPPPGQDGGQ